MTNSRKLCENNAKKKVLLNNIEYFIDNIESSLFSISANTVRFEKKTKPMLAFEPRTSRIAVECSID